MRTPTFATCSSRGGRARARAAAGGFTLLELLVVMAIMALLVGLAPVAFNRLYQTAQYRSTLRAVITDMRSARLQAQTEGVETRFDVNLQQRTFGVEGGPQHAVPDALTLRAVAAAREADGNGRLAIRFLPGGGASGGSVDLIRPSGAGMRLRVDWFSGRVEQEPIGP